jgi:hypothetical protein
MCDEPLDDLRWNWDSAYIIDHPEPDRWLAQRRDDRRTLVAETPEELRTKIAADYAARPVPREHCPPE